MEKDLDTLLDELAEKFSELENAIKQLRQFWKPGKPTENLANMELARGEGIWIRYRDFPDKDKWFSETADEEKPLPLVYYGYDNEVAQKIKELRHIPHPEPCEYIRTDLAWIRHKFNLAKAGGVRDNYFDALRRGGVEVHIVECESPGQPVRVALKVYGGRKIEGIKFVDDKEFSDDVDEVLARFPYPMGEVKKNLSDTIARYIAELQK